MQALKQSTAVTLKMGPFVSSADGVTAQTGLTITQPDVRLSKNGGNFAQKSAAGTATHDEDGYYDVSISTTDTGTLGRLKVAIFEPPALPVWQEFMVMPVGYMNSSLLGKVISGSPLLLYLYITSRPLSVTYIFPDTSTAMLSPRSISFSQVSL